MQRASSVCLAISLPILLAGVLLAEEGLVAHYAFDEGKGEVAADSSGNHNDGTIHGARWVPAGGGYALEFNGVRDFVDAGGNDSLDIRGPLTVSAWVFPAGQQNGPEPGLLGKQFSRFLITLWGADLAWYINWGAGGSYTVATAPTDGWFHVAATYDGTSLHIYANGTPVAECPTPVSAINGGGRFVIGCVVGDAASKDPALATSAFFKGCIDEVRLYSRALSAAEIGALYLADRPAERNRMLAAAFVPVEAVQTLRAGAVSVGMGARGGLEIANGSDRLTLASSFSFPGQQIGRNYLAETEVSAEAVWQVQVSKDGASKLSAKAAGSFYSLERSVVMRDGRIEIADTLSNLRRDPVAVLVQHQFTASGEVSNNLARNGASTPLLFFSQQNSDVGLVCEDDIGRLQFESTCLANRASVRHSHFALDAGKSYTFRYALYPLPKTGDVFDFVNRVRRDWKVGFTLGGPWEFLDLSSPLLGDPASLKQYVDRRNLSVVALTPFLDYDPGGMDHVLSRAEYQALAAKAVTALKSAKPGIQVVGSIETDWYSIFPERMKDGGLISQGNGQQIARVIDAANLDCRDSIKREKDGTVRIEYMHRGGKDQFAIGVYPRPGNFMHGFLLNQIGFLLDEVHLDGFYIDEFSQAWSTSIRSYEAWDGATVDIDPDSGEITQKAVDCSLVGIPSREAIVRAALERGRSCTANTYATSAAEQSLPAWRFAETQGFVIRNLPAEGTEPPFVGRIFDGVLGSPIGLGALQNPSEPDLAKGLMLAVVTYLRHGAVMYHYQYPALPENGPGAGEYGPLNHMFPITPEELHRGWIKGRERIVAARSLETDWSKPSSPRVLVFDLHGREVPAAGKATISGANGAWHIQLALRDWTEIAVVE